MTSTTYTNKLAPLSLHIQHYVLTGLVYLLVFYLLSLPLLAILRVLTGISIKRLGYLSLRHVSYTARPGITIYVGRIGMYLHRPSVAHPGWVSLSFSNFDIQLDPQIVLHPDYDLMGRENSSSGTKELNEEPIKDLPDKWTIVPQKTIAFRILRYLLTNLKFFTFYINGGSITYTGLMSFVVASLTVKIDLRNVMEPTKSTFVGTLDSSVLGENELPLKSKISLQDFYCGVGESDPTEFLESLTLDLDGVLGKDDLSLKDLSLGFKLGRISVFTDKLNDALERVRQARERAARRGRKKSRKTNGLAYDSDGSDTADSLDIRETAPRKSTSGKAKILSEKDLQNLTTVGTILLRIVKEVEIKVNLLGVFSVPVEMDESGRQALFAGSAKNICLELSRLNPNSPGFKLVFANDDSAHQAVLNIGSMKFGIDNGQLQDELIYVPMVTAVAKTNIFSKTLQLVREEGSQSNQNVLNALMNVSYPTFNIDTHHFPILIQAMQMSKKRPETDLHKSRGFQIPKWTQRLLPKSRIRFTMEEPASRVVMRAKNKQNPPMVVSSSSRLQCNLETGHQEENYTINASIQVKAFDTWYRSPSGDRYDLIVSETLTLKATGSTRPKPYLSISGQLSNAHIFVQKAEIFDSLRDILSHMRRSQRRRQNSDKKQSWLRQVPSWCARVKFEVADTVVSIASEKVRSSDDTLRGLSLKMANSVVEYRSDTTKKLTGGRCSSSSPGQTDQSGESLVPQSSKSTDKRRLTIVMDGIEGYRIIEPYGLEQRNENRFLEMPSLNITLSTMTLSSQPIVQCHVLLRDVVVTYDINLHFLALVVKDLLVADTSGPVQQNKTPLDSEQTISQPSGEIKSDFMTLQFKSENIRIKVGLPRDTKALIELCYVEAKQRLNEHLRISCRTVHLYSTHPNVVKAWGIVVSARYLDLNYMPNNIDEKILVNLSALRFNMPYQFIYFHLIDNSISLAKAVINLHEQFRTGDYKLVIPPKKRNKMPNVPRIRIKSPILLLTLEDDHFESDLNMIFQLGLMEQAHRLEKEAAFEAKLNKIDETKNAAKHEGPQNQPEQSRNTEQKEAELPPIHKEEDTALNEEIEPDSPRVKRLRKPHTHHTFTKLHNVFGGHKRAPRAKYQLADKLEPTADHSVNVETARERLLELFSTSWIQLYREARTARTQSIRQNINQRWGADEFPRATTEHERLVDFSDDPALFIGIFKGLDLVLDKPLFGMDGLHEYIHQVGKGVPMDYEFSLLIPLYIELKLEELRLDVRDYPLPLLHFPELQASQNPSLSAVNLKGHLVFAEGYVEGPSNIRPVLVPLVPSAYADTVEENRNSAMREYIIEVNRTVSSVKTYTDLNFDLFSANPTRISWAQCLQPALQTIAQNFDSFSKPPIDPSPKLGFWDKIRSVFHARIDFRWHEGDVLLLMKGSRSPYRLLKEGSGFVFGWKNGVRLTINGDDNPRQFLVVDSRDFILGVPNYAIWEKDYLRRLKTFDWALLNKTNFAEMDSYQKLIMKLNGRVRWELGLQFEADENESEGVINEPVDQIINELVNSGNNERGTSGHEHESSAPQENGNGSHYNNASNVESSSTTHRPLRAHRDTKHKRTMDLKPHYEVQLKMPQFVDNIGEYDAFQGFRSQYIHMAIGVSCSESTNISVNVDQSFKDIPKTYNTAHLTPFVFRHFSSWWGMFDGSLSLPIRAGKLFQPTQLVKPKLSRHLYTVQYKLFLEPVYLAHTYRHSKEEEEENQPANDHRKDAATGLKGKVDSLIIDLHQRREPHGHGKRWRMKLHLGEVDMKRADLRVLLAEFRERTPEEFLARNTTSSNSSSGESSSINWVEAWAESSVNSSTMNSSQQKAILDENPWMDMDDFSELEDILPLQLAPKIVILPLVYSPRWTYFRQTDRSGSDIGSIHGFEYYKFGGCLTHECAIGKRHPEITQAILLRQRIDEIQEQLKTNDATLDSLQRDQERFPNERKISERIIKVQKETENLNNRRNVITEVLHSAERNPNTTPHLRQRMDTMNDGLRRLTTNELIDIGEVLAEDLAAGHTQGKRPKNSRTLSQCHDKLEDVERIASFRSSSKFSNRFIFHNVLFKWNNAVRDAVYRYVHRMEYERKLRYYSTRKAVKYMEDFIGEDLSEVVRTVGEKVDEFFKNEKMQDSSSCEDRITTFFEDLHKHIGKKSHCAHDAYLFRFISPQLQLISDANPDQALVIASRNIEIRIVTIYDKEIGEDDMSRDIENRYGVVFDEAQFFVLKKQDVVNKAVLLFSGITYGTGKNSVWPPWLAVECCYDSSPLKEALVVERTTVAIRYDKPSPLHVSKDHGIGNAGGENPEDDGTIDPNFCSKTMWQEKYRPNRISVDFPRVVAICDSIQYFALYTIALDLLVYSEPTHKKTTEQMEKVLLTTDFSDLPAAISRIVRLQEDIGFLRDLRNDFYVHQDELDKHGLLDMVRLEVEIRTLIQELIVIMEAIKSRLQRNRKDDSSKYVKWAIAADEVILHALTEERKPLLDVGLAGAAFNRIEGRDGFNSNSVEVSMMQVFNLSPDCVYPEVLAPFKDKKHTGTSGGDQQSDERIVSVKWTMLDPIGGIPIMELLDVKMQPIKVQIEYEVGQQIFQYIFPKDAGSASPFQIPTVKHHSLEGDVMLYDGETIDSVNINGRGTGVMTNRVEKRSVSGFLSSNGNDRDSIRSGTTLRSRTSFSSGHSQTHHKTHFFKHSNSSQDSHDGGSSKMSSSKQNNTSSGDIATMMQRASDYMSIGNIMIHSAMLCVSYKGQGTRNLTDIHEFVIRIPDLTYKNEMWSNLDLALHLKRDVVKILFQHTGALIGNKLTKHRKKRHSQPLGQMSSYSRFTSLDQLRTSDRISEVPEESHSNRVAAPQMARLSSFGNTSSVIPEKPEQATEDIPQVRKSIAPSVSRNSVNRTPSQTGVVRSYEKDADEPMQEDGSDTNHQRKSTKLFRRLTSKIHDKD